MAEFMVHYQDFDELMGMIEKSGRDFNKELIEKAYHVALEAHGDQRRVSGVPYILHPTSVACILTDLGMDTDSIVAALLHDVVEDTSITLDEIKKEFGEDIAHLIDGVTKLKKIPYSNREVQQAENIRKMLMAMSDDIRVIIIKLADRLHNMRTIECMEEQKRRDKALENMEVYAPIAHRLGIRTIKEEMEDLSIRYLDPVAYSEIEHALSLTEGERTRFIEEIKKEIEHRAKGTVKNVHLEGRVKSINGIYRKTYMRGKTIEQIYDIFAVRVIVETIIDCYNVLGIIHDLYQPLPNRFKDYISTPKPNMYQSLHTTVIGKEGIPFEVQIRTWEMHHTAEYGIAAHWKYKVGTTKKDSMSDKVLWVRKMLDDQFDDETDILRNIKTDLAPEEVFVFTPKGDVISLPLGSNVIDMAYAIHTAVGNRMIGAKVDGKIAPINHLVSTGEIIQILTTKESKGPNRDWLKLVKTSEARGKIRQWFKKEKREENIIEGKNEVEREFKRNNIIIPEQDLAEFLSDILKKQFTTLDDFYASLGYGGMQLWKLMPRIKEEYAKRYKEEHNEIAIKEKSVKKKISSGVIIEGIDDCLVKFSKCCNPLPEDEIIGFITRGFGVSIHKRSCNNVPEIIENAEEPERWVAAHWSNTVKESYQTTLIIHAVDRAGLLADIANQLSSLHIFIHNINSREDKRGMVVMHLSITVNNMEQLNGVINRLSAIDGVTSASRT